MHSCFSVHHGPITISSSAWSSWYDGDPSSTIPAGAGVGRPGPEPRAVLPFTRPRYWQNVRPACACLRVPSQAVGFLLFGLVALFQWDSTSRSRERASLQYGHVLPPCNNTLAGRFVPRRDMVVGTACAGELCGVITRRDCKVTYTPEKKTCFT